MTSDYATLTPDLTAAQAIERLRKEAPDKETIYYAYVLDQVRHLVGFVSLKDLILAHANARIGKIMHRDVIHARVDDDQEEAARKIQKYDLLALPVVNDEGALVGIITHDDAIDIITQEHTEDMEKLMAIGGSHEAGVYLRTSSWTHFKNRAVWIVGLAGLGLISGVMDSSMIDRRSAGRGRAGEKRRGGGGGGVADGRCPNNHRFTGPVVAMDRTHADL